MRQTPVFEKKDIFKIESDLRCPDRRWFSQFVGHLTILREFLDAKGISYQYLDGSTLAKERQVRIKAFQNGERDFFLISRLSFTFVSGADIIKALKES